jgi:hypothetical protein
MSRAIRMTVVGGSCLLLLSAAGPALADEHCDPLDLACTVGPITGDPGELVDDPDGMLRDTIGRVADATDPIVQPILDAVDELLGGGGIVDPPGGGTGGNRVAPDPPGGRRPSGDRGSVGSGAAGATALVREATSPPETIISAASGSRPSVPNGSGERSDGVVTGAVQSLVIVMVLFGIAVGFVLLQDRIDRRDPKLALAPLEPEVVTFG